MPYTVDFNTVSTVGLESSPVASALAGLRANEARYFKNKYDHVFTVESASNAKNRSGGAWRGPRSGPVGDAAAHDSEQLVLGHVEDLRQLEEHPPAEGQVAVAALVPGDEDGQRLGHVLVDLGAVVHDRKG